MFWDVHSQICERICWISAVGRSKDRVCCFWKLRLPKSLFLFPGRGWGHPEQTGKAGWTSRNRKKNRKNNQGTKNSKGCGVFHPEATEKLHRPLPTPICHSASWISSTVDGKREKQGVISFFPPFFNASDKSSQSPMFSAFPALQERFEGDNGNSGLFVPHSQR